MARPISLQESRFPYLIEGHTHHAPALAPGLYVVATPIGNLGDMTIRGLRTLAAADVVLCEDTRTTIKLLNHFGIKTTLKAYHEHNASRVRPGILRDLEKGASVALVSDAGTPLVSDPGFKLVSEASALQLPVTPIPGASAPLAALMAAGLPSDRFHFVGFLPVKAGQRTRELETLQSIPATLVFFESARRIAATIDAMLDSLGNRPAVIARELTKMHEEVIRGELSDLRDLLADRSPLRGEIVILVAPPLASAPLESGAIDALLVEALKAGSVKDAAETVAAQTGIPRRTLYTRAVSLRNGGKDDDPESGEGRPPDPKGPA